MAIDVDKSFEVSENGYSLRDFSGNIVGYMTFGSGDPTGSSAPSGSWYFRTDNLTIWYKFGAGNNEWRQIRAEDITFDNSIANFPNSPDTIQKALEEARGARFQYSQFQKIGQMNFDQYLFANNDQGGTDRESGNPSNGYQFGNSAPQTVAFDGTVDNATASIRGIAQSTGTPAANLELLFELWKVGFNGEGTKLGDITFNIDTSLYTIGNFWNSSIVTAFGEEQSQASNNVSVSAGDLLALKFIRRTGNANVVAVENTTVVLEITGNA